MGLVQAFQQSMMYNTTVLDMSYDDLVSATIKALIALTICSVLAIVFVMKLKIRDL